MFSHPRAPGDPVLLWHVSALRSDRRRVRLDPLADGARIPARHLVEALLDGDAGGVERWVARYRALHGVGLEDLRLEETSAVLTRDGFVEQPARVVATWSASGESDG